MHSFPHFSTDFVVCFGFSEVPRSDPTKVRRLPVTDDRMAEILVQMESVLNIVNNVQELSESLRTHVRNISWSNLPVLKVPIKVPQLTIDM